MTEHETLTGTSFRFGHRKLSALLGTLLSGEFVGQDVLIWAWDLTELPPMPDDVASSLFTLLAVIVFYFLNEERAQ